MVESASIRAFVAISLEPRLKEAIQHLQEQLRSLNSSHVVRWVRPEQLHLTLKFLGKLPSSDVAALIDALRSSCHGITAFPLSIAGLGCFPSIKKPNVIWLGVSGDLPVLESLQNRIGAKTESFGRHSEERDFRPHLTIGRTKAHSREARELGPAIQNHLVGELGRWVVREVELIQSTLSPEGSSYRSLAAVPLDPQ